MIVLINRENSEGSGLGAAVTCPLGIIFKRRNPFKLSWKYTSARDYEHPLGTGYFSCGGRYQKFVHFSVLLTTTVNPQTQNHEEGHPFMDHFSNKSDFVFTK